MEFVFFNILNCRTTRRDSRGSAKELKPDQLQGMVQLGMPAPPNKKGEHFTVHLSTLNNILIMQGQIGLGS
jgi:hypothetical protein